jgi:hypothetical protein
VLPRFPLSEKKSPGVITKLRIFGSIIRGLTRL